MVSVEEFETMLKEVVAGKRLSQSKMTKLTEIALKCMESDTQLVSILYRTHKSLPTPSKISSLYAFDALCRAARHQAVKQGQTGDINSEKGNCATFLLKVEGVLDGLFTDMINTGASDAKEKTKKILDIWTKANTFSSTVLIRLAEIVKAEKDTNKSSTATNDPRANAHTTVITPPTKSPPEVTPAPPVSDPQATLLALLSQVANSSANNNGNGQTTANTAVSQPQIDPLQLVLLQQLAANKVNLANVVPTQQIPQSVSGAHQVGPNAGVVNSYSAAGPSQSPPRVPYPDTDRGDPRYSRYDEDYERGSPRRGGHFDDRRGGFRGHTRGGFRGRGRGDFRESRFSDRDRLRDRDSRYGEDWDRQPYKQKSRSRSPPPPRGMGGRRDIHPYSPPGRPSISSSSSRKDPLASDTGKDEFGRDIRPPSPPGSNNINTVSSSSTAPMNLGVSSTYNTVREGTTNDEANAQRQAQSSMIMKPPSPRRESQSTTSGTNPRLGLESFDVSTFDFTNPESWTTLGDMFQVTNGYMPSQEELMMIVSESMAAASQGVVGGNEGGWGAEQNWTDSRGGHTDNYYRGSRGRGRGRGSYGGYGRSTENEWSGYTDTYEQNSDAVVLGGDNATGGSVSSKQQPASGSVGASGQMKKVGDKWVFVREGTSV